MYNILTVDNTGGNMKKQVKDVFFNCINENGKFQFAYIDELKFSKKLNSVILKASSEDNIKLSEIEQFELDACKNYELKSYKVEYEYKGKLVKIDETQILSIIDEISDKYEYTNKVFKDSKISVDNDTNSISILLNNSLSNFLSSFK
jgi:heme oxygenase